MKKRVLIIGNSYGLPGVKVDIGNYKVFFKSASGGNWFEHEIIEKLNSSHAEITTQLEELKSMSLDHLIIIFSGHGGQERETVLELNASGEQISETRLKNLADRQVNIYDCCRCYPRNIFESGRNKLETKAFGATSTRQKYENRIMEAINQQVYLYACSIGESAHDTSDGGAYSKNLINCSLSREKEFVLVGDAHEAASALTAIEYRDQHPQADLPRCLSSQQLIIGIRP